MFRAYLIVQIKRLLRVLPVVVLFNFIMMIGICAIFALRVGIQEQDERKIGVGIVGNIDNKYMKLGVEMLNNMDSSRVSIKFESMDDSEAKKALREGQIIGYFKIDRDFIDGLENGENRPIVYVSSNGGLMSELSKELASIFSVLIIDSERVIYAADEYLVDHPVYDRVSANTEFNMWLIKNVLARGKIYDVENISVMGNISAIDGYVCGIITLFIMLSGVGLSGLLSGDKVSMLRVLKSKGLSYMSSIICELIISTIYVMISMLILIGGFIIVKSFLLEKSLLSIDSFEFVSGILIVSIMFASMHIFIYELIDQRVVAVLIEILLGISLGYIGGCIYPLSVFPDLIQKVAIFLPSGAGMKLLISGMDYNINIMAITVLIIYTIMFIGGGYVLRNKK
ncbi:ABC transporter permease [Lachnoanaerobaculum umeaense]|uniref:ABC transporter permease n=1 Tax=Lachnoanaerobaculum umeaense TaxID=617123 RepID=A0A385Q111_9FIRM|nr:ABC transporter permease [Lachnoanaerobaculum umeaense]AYA99982.1 ABC transporter permease [Lachnoanaerobaculum umeaense]PZW94049.1 ABC-2 family transporter [Lachnoanaerobaculum umeaense]